MLAADWFEAETFLGQALIATGQSSAGLGALDSAVRRMSRFLDRQLSPATRMGVLESYREAHARLLAALAAGPAPPGAVWRRAAASKAREHRRGRALRAARTTSAWPDDTVLLDYHVGDGTTFLFVVHRRRIEVRDLGIGARRLATAVRRLIEPLLSAGEAAEPQPYLDSYDPGAAAQLAHWLVGDCLARLPATAVHLLVAADGPLHAVPFEALPAPAAGPIGERFVVRYVVSPASARPTRPRRAGRASLLVLASGHAPADVGAPPESPVARLPGVLREARHLRRLFPGARVLAGRQATPPAFWRAIARSRLVHVGAHALAHVEELGRAAIVLAPPHGGGRTASVTAEEIARHEVTAELITLAACETTRGRAFAGEGPQGLARAFLDAGARSVLATLWPVDDRTTSELMAAFYGRLAAGVERGRALTEAKAELRRARGRPGPPRDHPFFWAPFVLLDQAPPLLPRGFERRRPR